jgi:hypothetical protein
MKKFDWPSASSILSGFGGTPVTLHIQKTGLPFFDALRLYGAIELYIGLREDVSIRDLGSEWVVEGRARTHRLAGRGENAFKALRKEKKPSPQEFCDGLRTSIMSGEVQLDSDFLKGGKGYDAILQAGIRGLSATKYETLQSGQTSKKECIAQIPLSHGFLAFVGRNRTETIGQIVFLPMFEGRVDLSKVVSPLAAWLGVPNPLCAQALILLALRTSLFAEGYQERLTAVVFNTDLGGKRSDNYSGIIAIGSTAIGQIVSSELSSHMNQVFRELLRQAWKRTGTKYQTTETTPLAMGMAYWLMQPARKHLSGFITAQEGIYRRGRRQFFIKRSYVKEVFEMSYGDWKGDHDAVRRLASAVASGIYHARMAKEHTWADQRKAWYDEVTMLRSAPSPRAFMERAMILVEQGHREHSLIGTTHWDQAFDPQGLFESIGASRSSFETFRELFRMYLVQQSTHQVKELSGEESAPGGVSSADPQEPEPSQEDQT